VIFAAAEKKNGRSFGGPGDAGYDHIVKGGFRRDLLVIIEDQRPGRRKPGEEIFKKKPVKLLNSPQIFRGQDGQGLARAGGRTISRNPEVVEEAGEIVIPSVDPIPEGGDLPGLQVGTDQGCFPASRRTAYPQQRSLLATPVDEVEESRSGQAPAWDGPGDLGERGRKYGHGSPREARCSQLTATL